MPGAWLASAPLSPSLWTYETAFCGGRKDKKTIGLETIDIIQQKIIVNKVMEGVKEVRSQILDTF